MTRMGRSGAILLSIVFIAIVLRVWGIWFGLPHLFHEDEDFEVIRALRLGTGDFDFTRIGKGGYFFLLFAEYVVLFFVLLATGTITSANEFAELYIKDPTAFYLVGRATTTAIGAATVYLTYRVGELAYSKNAGIIAALLLAVNITHASISHFVTVDVPMTFLALLTLYFALKISKSGLARDYRWAALFAALATTTKIPAVLLILSLLAAHYFSVAKNQGGALKQFFGRNLWQSIVIFLSVYLITTPGIVLYAEDLLWSILSTFGFAPEVEVTSGNVELDSRAMWLHTNLFLYYIVALKDSMTWPIFLVAALGLAYAAVRRRPADWILTLFAVTTYVVISLSASINAFFPRYIVPAIPIFLLLAGRLLDDVFEKILGGRRSMVPLALVLLLAVWPTATIISANIKMTMLDTRTVAREWFDANIPQNSKVFIEGWTNPANSTIPLRRSEENLKRSIAALEGTDPGKAKYLRIELKVLSGKAYDLVIVKPMELEELAYYKRQGIQYFVLRPKAYPGSRIYFQWEDLVAAIREDTDIQLIKSFDPEIESGPGPYIEIYRVLSNTRQDGDG